MQGYVGPFNITTQQKKGAGVLPNVQVPLKESDKLTPFTFTKPGPRTGSNLMAVPKV